MMKDGGFWPNQYVRSLIAFEKLQRRVAVDGYRVLCFLVCRLQVPLDDAKSNSRCSKRLLLDLTNPRATECSNSQQHRARFGTRGKAPTPVRQCLNTERRA